MAERQQLRAHIRSSSCRQGKPETGTPVPVTRLLLPFWNSPTPRDWAFKHMSTRGHFLSNHGAILTSHFTCSKLICYSLQCHTASHSWEHSYSFSCSLQCQTRIKKNLQFLHLKRKWSYFEQWWNICILTTQISLLNIKISMKNQHFIFNHKNIINIWMYKKKQLMQFSNLVS